MKDHQERLRAQIKTAAEIALVAFVEGEGFVCGWTFTEAQQRIASRLVRRGVLSSRRGIHIDGCRCGRRDYTTNVIL